MSKWADYVITKVQYETTSLSKHISKVTLWTDDGDKLSNERIITREEVVREMARGKTFCTAIRSSSDGNWGFGAMVTQYAHTVHFIKTKSDNTSKDNLEQLPTF